MHFCKVKRFITGLLKFNRNLPLWNKKKKEEVDWWGPEPQVMEVVKKQLKEIDGGDMAVDAKGRTLYREATVTLSKI